MNYILTLLNIFRDNSGLRGDDTIDLVAGDTHIIQYSNVGHLVENEKVKLD